MARILVIRQSFYGDLDVQRKIDALVETGHEVDVICLRKPGERLRERHGPIRVYRVPLPHARGGTLVYLAKYAGFLAAAGTLAALLHLRRRYRVVEAYSMPDVLVFAALVPKLLGAKVLLTLLETMPEFFATKFERGMDHRAVRLVSAAEQASIRFADHVVTCTEEMREAFAGRGATTPITVVLNSADETIFAPGRAPVIERPGEFTVVCHGTIEERYGLDTLVRAAALTRDDLPDLRVLIFGEGEYRETLVALVEELGVGDRVDVAEGLVPLDELVGTIEGAEAGVVAMKRDAFRELTHCNKMFEFISMRVPAAVSRLRSVDAYFDEDSFGWFEPGDERDLARVLRELHADPQRRRALAEHAASVAEPYRWPHQRDVYLNAIGPLIERH
jgi:glycosyltransferase involved in cell wall biosynthesis